MNQRLFSVLEKYLKEDQSSQEELFNQISLYIYYIFSTKSQSDLYILAKLLSNSELRKVIKYFSGDKINIPSYDEFIEANILTVCYFLKEIKGWHWDKIKELFPSKEYQDFDFSSISFGKKINSIKESMRKDLANSLKSLNNIDEEKIKKFLSKK